MPATPDHAPQPVGDDTRDRAPTGLAREVLSLAIPAFATLVAEPLMVMVDSAVVGHLSTDALAGLGVAASLLTIPISLCIFLAYGTTASVARHLGAGRQDRALQVGLDGLVLGAGLGIVLAAVMSLSAGITVGFYDATPAAAEQASSYLRVSAIGLAGLLVMLASTGVLRGLQDTRTPLWVAIGVNVLNAALTIGLVRGTELGIVGAAIGTAVAQLVGGAVLATIVIHKARRIGVRLRPTAAGVLATARQGGWLVVRTATLQAAITTTAAIATSFGTIAIAAHQVTNALWALLAMMLDSIAIAAQAIIGRYLGAGRVRIVRLLTARMLLWGVVAGVVFGVGVFLTHPLYAGFFSPDPQVQALLAKVLVVVAVVTPVSAAVFVLDGVLIGAGDARYLALAGLIALGCYLPLALAVYAVSSGETDPGQLVWLWVAYTGFMAARLVTLGLRARGDRWLRTGD